MEGFFAESEGEDMLFPSLFLSLFRQKKGTKWSFRYFPLLLLRNFPAEALERPTFEDGPPT